MINLANEKQNTWQVQFLDLLPSIQLTIAPAFRHLNCEARSEATAEVVANTCVAFARLVESGKANLAYPSVLARYGIAQYRSGRRVGTRTNTQDVTSPAAQRKHGFSLTSLSGQGPDDNWKSIVVEDRTSGPADVAAFRIDFSHWSDKLKPRHRRIAIDLGNGHSTSAVAKRHHLTSGRISQLRRALEKSWIEFHEPSTSARVNGKRLCTSVDN